MSVGPKHGSAIFDLITIAGFKIDFDSRIDPTENAFRDIKTTNNHILTGQYPCL